MGRIMECLTKYRMYLYTAIPLWDGYDSHTLVSEELSFRVAFKSP
jgi:hypothetical protein